MPINTFNGVAIFGICVKMTPEMHDAARQETAYPGLSGVESLSLGGRGRVTHVRGILTGDTTDDLVAARTLLESYNDGLPRTFFDSAGFGWTNCVLTAPKFEGGFRSGGGAGYWWPYQASVRHLSAT